MHVLDVRELGDRAFEHVCIGGLTDGRFPGRDTPHPLFPDEDRIRVNAWLPDDPYPLADVDDWPDEDPDAAGLGERVASLTARLSQVIGLAVELGDVPAGAVDLASIDEDPLVGSYHLAALAPLGPADRHRLLCAPSPAARLDLLAESLDDVEAMLRFRLSPGPT